MKKLLALWLIISLSFVGVTPAFAKEKTKRGSLIKKAIIGYVAYKVITSGKDKNDKKDKQSSYKTEEHYYSYDEECEEDEEECEEE